MNYDLDVRRQTPLAEFIKTRISADGPMPVAAYVDHCLNHPEFGYYRTRQAIGRSGDFITAPEISQIFGELIGLWAAAVWQSMGAPNRVHLVEIGPGRGTLMKDILRATRLVPAFEAARAVTLIESNPILRAAQRECLPDEAISWGSATSEIPADAPRIIVANEFLDVLPVAQHVVRQGRLFDRVVTLSKAGTLEFGDTVLGELVDRRLHADIADGAIIETPVALDAIAPLGRPGVTTAALFIDYGHVRTTPGDTLQAVRAHAFEHPLTSPGEADLSFQVDFEAVAHQLRALDLTVDGPITQAEFLGRLGIAERPRATPSCSSPTFSVARQMREASSPFT